MSHDDMQPPDVIPPEGDDDDRIRGALRDLARLHAGAAHLILDPRAAAILDRLMQHAYAEGRKDQAAEDAGPAVDDHQRDALQQFIDFGDQQSCPGGYFSRRGWAGSQLQDLVNNARRLTPAKPGAPR